MTLPTNTQRDYNVFTTSLQRRDVAATLLRRCVFAGLMLGFMVYADSEGPGKAMHQGIRYPLLQLLETIEQKEPLCVISWAVSLENDSSRNLWIAHAQKRSLCCILKACDTLSRKTTVSK